MKRTRWSIVVIAAVVTLLALPIVGIASHSWANYHWARTSNPFPLSLGDNVSGSWDQHLLPDISQMESSAFINAPCWDSGDYTTTP